MVLIFFAVARTQAQDVTVTNPVWLSNDPAPEQLPISKSQLRPTYPVEMRKHSEIGYVILTRYIDASGKNINLSRNGSAIVFLRAVEEAIQDWKVSPAKNGGQPVASQFWVAAIFNPKSAAPEARDATPRLIAVAPAFTPSRPGPSADIQVVPVKLKLDESGAITGEEPQVPLKPKTQDAVMAALKLWRFAPARKDGTAISAELVIPVVCLPPQTATRSKMVPAKVIDAMKPIYPYAMRRFGLEGQVTLDFVVDTDGKVQNPFVHSSDNPAFEEPALAAVRKWKFQPATKDGQPVKIHQRVPIKFQLDGHAESAFLISGRTDQTKLPPELRYDTPPKIRNVLIPVYPYTQRRDGKTGKAVVMMLIGTNGRVGDVRVISADLPEFGLALTAAIEGFQFDPALKDGKPVSHLLRFEQAFNEVDLNDDAANRLLSLEKKHPERILTSAKLDAPLKPMSRRPPVVPVANGLANQQGEALVECLIDEDGHVRAPRIVRATAPGFGYAAVQAVNTWWFEPAKSGGKPAVVRVQIPFDFSEKKPAKPTAPAAQPRPGEATTETAKPAS